MMRSQPSNEAAKAAPNAEQADKKFHVVQVHCFSHLTKATKQNFTELYLYPVSSNFDKLTSMHSLWSYQSWKSCKTWKLH